MRSKVFISLFIVFAMLASAMIPLSMYDNGNVEGDDEGEFFLISSVEELSKVGKGTDNTEPEYQEWTLDANYRLTQDIVFGPDDNTNGGVMINLVIDYDGVDEFTVTLEPEDGSVDVNSLYIWIGTEHMYFTSLTAPFQGTIHAPSDSGIYTMSIGGELSNGTFAYATDEIKIVNGMTSGIVVSTTFDSNGNFDPIGTSSSSAFTGIFDGAGFEISGINVADASLSGYGSVYAGLFGYVRGTTADNVVIKDLGITDGYFVGVSNYILCLGGVVGRADYSSIIDCYNTNDVIAAGTKSIYAGGIVGQTYTELEIKNCYNTGDVVVTSIPDFGQSYAGGIFGWADSVSSSSIENCYNIGNVTTTTNPSTAGLVYSVAGGIAGRASSMTNCYNTGDVTANGKPYYAYAGGIAGRADTLNIKNCYNSGDVTATATPYGTNINAVAGGIVGHASGPSPLSIVNCYNIGNVIATAGGTSSVYVWAGGIAGYASSSSIKNCYNIGYVTAVTTAAGDHVNVYEGGIAGQAPNRSITHSYFLEKGDLELTGRGDYIGVVDDDSGSRDAVDMRDKDNYTGWNFETDPIIWGIYPDINDGFPVLEAFMFDLVLIYEGDGNVTGPVRIYGGSTVTIIVIPDDGNRIKSVTDNGNDVTALVLNNEYDITNIFGDRAIKVAFEAVAVPDIDPDIDPDKRLAFIIILAMVLGTMIIVGVIMVRRRDQEEN